MREREREREGEGEREERERDRGERESESERGCRHEHRSFLFPWGYVTLGIEWTRCLFVRTNQLPQLPWSFDRPTPQLD